MIYHWSTALVGLPYQVGAAGPDAFDCWGLLCYIYKEQLGVELDRYPHLNFFSKKDFMRQIESAVSIGGDWEELRKPTNLCAVGLSANNRIHHIGIYLSNDSGCILHSKAGPGVIIQSLASIRASGNQKILFYKHKSHASDSPEKR